MHWHRMLLFSDLDEKHVLVSNSGTCLVANNEYRQVSPHLLMDLVNGCELAKMG